MEDDWFRESIHSPHQSLIKNHSKNGGIEELRWLNLCWTWSNLKLVWPLCGQCAGQQALKLIRRSVLKKNEEALKDPLVQDSSYLVLKITWYLTPASSACSVVLFSLCTLTRIKCVLSAELDLIKFACRYRWREHSAPSQRQVMGWWVHLSQQLIVEQQ